MNKEIKEALQQFVEQGFSIAEKNIDNEDRKVEPVMFIFGETQNYVVMVPWDNEEAKIESLKTLGRKCIEEFSAHRMALLVDVAMKHYNSPEDARYAAENRETEAPLSYPESMRVDALLLHYMDFKEPKDELFWMYPYKVKDRAMIREPLQDMSGGDFQGLLKDTVTFGFTMGLMMKEFRLREPLEISQQLARDVFESILKDYPGIKPPTALNF